MKQARCIVATFLITILFMVNGSWYPVVAQETKQEIQLKLQDQIEKIIEAGHLRPGYFYAGLIDWFLYREQGDWLDQYFHNPADTTYFLLRALPYMPDSPYPHDPGKTWKEKLSAYIQSEWSSYPPTDYTHVGWQTGADRTDILWPPEFTQAFQTEGPRVNDYGFPGWRFNPFNFYAASLYAEKFGGASEIFTKMQSKFKTDPDMIFLEQHPHAVNVYIAGCIGYLKLQDLAGQTRSSVVTQLLTDLENLRLTIIQNTPPEEISGAEAGGFIYLVPELANYLSSHARTEVSTIATTYDQIMPYWFEARADEQIKMGTSTITSSNEGSTTHLYAYHSLFQARAQILHEPFEELEKYLDVPAFERGDLFYIDNLVSLLEAPSTGITVSPTPNGSGSPTPTSTPSTPGDTDGDTDVDIFDYNAVITDFGKTGGQGFSVADFDGDGDVDIFDYNVVISNFGR